MTGALLTALGTLTYTPTSGEFQNILTNEPIEFNTEEYTSPSLSLWLGTTGMVTGFQVRNSGTYLILFGYAGALSSYPSSQGNAIYQLVVNGATNIITAGSAYTITSTQNGSTIQVDQGYGSTIYTLSAGDYVELYNIYGSTVSLGYQGSVGTSQVAYLTMVQLGN
jgi:hypothetical protein